MTDALPLHLVVHIGGHKTGTTAIQDAALHGVAELAASGVFYPAHRPYFRYAQHSRLADVMKAGRLYQVERFLVAAAREARSLRATTVFLSGEELWTLSPRSVGRFRDLAEQQFQSIRIVCVVRNERDRILSNFKHFLRHDPARSLTRFARDNKRILRPAPEIWGGVFGERVLVLPYEEMAETLVPDFFQNALGCTLSHNPRANVSFDLLSLAINHVFIKDWKGADIEAALWDYFTRFERFPQMPIESVVADDLLRLTGAWPPRGSGQDGPMASTDPVETCERMIFLFTRLREAFQKRSEA